MSIVARSIRVEDKVWEASSKKAKQMGVSLSFVIKNYLKKFSSFSDPIVVIDEGEVLLSDDLQKKADDLAILASQKLKERFSSPA